MSMEEIRELIESRQYTLLRQELADKYKLGTNHTIKFELCTKNELKKESNGDGERELGLFIFNVTDYLRNQIVGHFRGHYGFFHVGLGDYTIALYFCRQKPRNHVTVL